MKNRTKKNPKGLCPCGKPSVRYTCGGWACQSCLEKDAAIWASEKCRGTCGFVRYIEPYRVIL